MRRLFDSDQGCDVRLFVRDNASSDGTVETIRDAVPEAALDAGTQDIGFGAAVNSLLASSDAPWFLLAHPAAWPTPGALGTLVETARIHRRAAAIAPRIEDADGDCRHSTYTFPSPRTAIYDLLRDHIPKELAAELMLEGAWTHDRPRNVDWAASTALLLRRAAVEETGPFDERFRGYAEPLEWCWRAYKHSWAIRFEPTAVFRLETKQRPNYGLDWAEPRERAHDAYRFYVRMRGRRRAIGLWAVSLTGTCVRLAAAMVGRDPGRIDYWRQSTVTQLSALRALELLTDPEEAARSRPSAAQ